MLAIPAGVSRIGIASQKQLPAFRQDQEASRELNRPEGLSADLMADRTLATAGQEASHSTRGLREGLVTKILTMRPWS